jgi:hypothetical protein
MLKPIDSEPQLSNCQQHFEWVGRTWKRSRSRISSLIGAAIVGCFCNTSGAQAAGVDVKIVDVVNVTSVSDRDAVNAILVFDKPVLNAQASLAIDFQGRISHLTLWPVTADKDGKVVELGDLTTRLEAQWSPKKERLVPEQLRDHAARILTGGAHVSGDRLSKTPAAFPVRITELRQVSMIDERDIANATVVFDRSCPNRQGTLLVNLDGRHLTVSLWPVNKDEKTGKRIPLGQPTRALDAQWSPKKDNLDLQQVIGHEAQIYMAEVRMNRPGTSAAHHAAATWIHCAEYSLTVLNSQFSFVFDLEVKGADGKRYQLRVTNPKSNTGLVQNILPVMSKHWPAFDVEFQADSAGNITDVR